MIAEETDAVVLLSGGIDSATTLAVAANEGRRCHALSFDYGQRHRIELECAARIAASLGAVEHRIIPLALGGLGGSSLTDPSLRVPCDRGDEALRSGIPSTYVPARNTVFLAFALSFAEVIASRFVYIGATSVDYSGYPDCRPEYFEAFGRLAALATKCGVEGSPVRIITPLLHLSKAEIIRKGIELGVDYSLTLSCYDPDAEGRACGRCDSCLLRRRGFLQAGAKDPAAYR